MRKSCARIFVTPYLAALVILFLSCGLARAQMYKTDNGKIFFRSNAPLEVIEARSYQMKGLIDVKKMTYAFSVPIHSFFGFNSPLQEEHFNENYMESGDYPTASFRGKIIEQVDLTRDGEYTIRAKGILSIHGVEQERIIKSDVLVLDGILRLKSVFSIPLNDHNISIPRIVNQKIAEDINVSVEAQMKYQAQ